MKADALWLVPWYRQLWPWLLIAGPAIAVVAGFATLWLAIRSDDGLVADDYYKQGLAINRTLQRTALGAELNIEAIADVAADGLVVVRLTGDGALAAPPAIRFTLGHPTRAGADRKVTLLREGDGRYSGRIAPVEAGRWQIRVETDAWRLPAVETDGPLVGVRLRPPKPAE